MLSEPTITAFLPTVMPEKAKRFYLNTLGLNLSSEDSFGMEFNGKGAVIRITTVNEFRPHPFTVLGFKVDDIVKNLNALLEKQVTFERYGFLKQDELGIWKSPSKAMVAWFKDPDGNVLSLTQYS